MDGLIGLLIFIVILAVIIVVLKYIIDLIPMPEPFGKIAWILLMLIALLLILQRALPLLHV